MKGRFPFQKLPKYPHLRPCDVKIWERFLSAYPNFYQSVDYDLKVGTPRDYKEAPADKIREDLEYLSRKRVDVVGYRDGVIHIIEVKPSAGVSAIGQVECYFDLYLPFLPERYSLFAVIITDVEMPDIKDLCFKRAILYFVV